MSTPSASRLPTYIAAESRAKMIYERLINVTDDPGIKEALGFLMTREVAHQKSFEKALYAIEPSFPSGKLLGMPEFTDTYYDMSQGNGAADEDVRGPWNSGDKWQRVSNRDQQAAVYGGDGTASEKLHPVDEKRADYPAPQTEGNLNVKSDDEKEPVHEHVDERR
jgi:Mn-containing catalase